MLRSVAFAGLFLIAHVYIHAQWESETSNTTADLRGIDSIGNGVAWASGTHGTVLRTEDSGFVWQTCAMPPGAEKLDFRGIQGVDANIAIVMSSGKGDQSRLYKTTDGCSTWKLLLTNPDPEGFWDAIILNRFNKNGVLLGDPVNGQFVLLETSDKGDTWSKTGYTGLAAQKEEGAFAASNSSVFLDERIITGFVTGGPSGPRIFTNEAASEHEAFKARALPLQGGSPGAGAFSVATRDRHSWVVVGGDYTKPDDPTRSAAYTMDGGKSWHASRIPPHGYRSSVAYEKTSRTWITVGPNGTDVSSDDGQNWRPLRPDAGRHEERAGWNAISLPFVVGPHGRIGKLNSAALKH